VLFKYFGKDKESSMEFTEFRHQCLDNGFEIYDEDEHEVMINRKNMLLKKLYEEKKKKGWNDSCRYFCIICENMLRNPHELKQGFHDICFAKLK